MQGILPFRNADEILPGLWLGNAAAARDKTFFLEKKIQSVFNCTKDLPFLPGPWTKHRVPVDDNLRAEEIRNLELWSVEIVYKILHASREGPVLVHCAAGMQRSAASVAMTLIAKLGMTTDQAVIYIKERRPIAFTPAINFEKAIRSFEAHYDAEIRPVIQESLPNRG